MMKKVMPFYEVTEQDQDLVLQSMGNIVDLLTRIYRGHLTKSTMQEIMELSFKLAWQDYTANKVLIENLGHEGVDARVKFRDNHNAMGLAKGYCLRAIEKAQEKPVLFTQDGTPLINS